MHTHTHEASLGLGVAAACLLLGILGILGTIHPLVSSSALTVAGTYMFTNHLYDLLHTKGRPR